jgi:hypothetical protein
MRLTVHGKAAERDSRSGETHNSRALVTRQTVEWTVAMES